MRNLLFAVALLLVAVSAQAQKVVNDANAEKRTVSGFHAIEVGGGIDLYLSQGEEGVAVSATETQYRDRIKTEVVNGVLKIKYEPENKLRIGWNSDKRKLKAYVSFKTLDKLNAGGGCDVVVEGTIKSGSLNIHMSGGSDFTGKVEVTDLVANANGGSDIDISGTAKKATIEASGGSDVNGFGLNVESCIAEASGGSDIEITASKEVSVHASGGSDIHYKGNAVVTNSKSSGGGSVKKVSK